MKYPKCDDCKTNNGWIQRFVGLILCTSCFFIRKENGEQYENLSLNGLDMCWTVSKLSKQPALDTWKLRGFF